MLVVLGIMIVLMGILVPTVGRMAAKASRTAALSDLEAIAAALEAYKSDFGDYPRVRVDPGLSVAPPTDPAPNPPTGAQILCQALYGPCTDVDPMPDAMKRPRQDGAKGLGFRARPGGKIYPPYLPPERFRIGIDTETGNQDFVNHGLRMTIIDRYNKSVLYFPAAATRPNVRMATAAIPAPYVDLDVMAVKSELSMYDALDNYRAFDEATASPPKSRKKIRLFLGDDNFNGIIDGNEQPYEKPFLLWSAGPDEKHGPTYDMASPDGNADGVTDLDAKDAARCDDVTNFRVNSTR